jgi:PKD repeat protein
MKSFITLILFTLVAIAIQGQSQTQNVLFVGNSYTYYNNMPLIVANLALSMGDTLIYDSSTPGGHTLEQHSANATTLSKIAQGGWDYVVLQEQSQRPSFPMAQVETQVLPFAAQLNELILTASPCAETVFYMTWGRKNGDAGNCPNWPPVCTYVGMDDLLYERYMLMADLNDGIVSPVGALWRYIRDNHPGIDLYDPDESHPSASGSFASACAFYTVIFRKNPALSNYNFNLPAEMATTIKNAAETVVFNNLSQWKVGEYDLSSSFESNVVEGLPVEFNNLSLNATSYLWNFGDGNTSTEENPVHTYDESGLFNVELTAYSDCDSAVSSAEVNIVVLNTAFTEKSNLSIYPNPVRDQLIIENTTAVMTNMVLMNTTGAVIWQSEQRNFKTILNTNHLPAGLYLLKIWDDTGIPSVHKIIRTDF